MGLALSKRKTHKGVMVFASVGVAVIAGFSLIVPHADAATGVMDDTANFALNTSNGSSVWATNTQLPAYVQSGYAETKKIALVSNEAGSGLTPIYLVYKASTKDYMLTASNNEYNSAMSRYGYTGKGIVFYARWSDNTQTEPVVRYQKGALHRNVISAADQQALVNDGWRKEGVTFYAVPPAAEPVAEPTVPSTQPGDGDNKFSLAILPDTQQETAISGDQFDERTKFIASQMTPRDIRFVGHTGDIVSAGGNNTDTANLYQYEVASKAFLNIDQTNVPYLLSPGNHDTAAVCGGGSACPGQDVRVNIRDTTVLNRYFPETRLKLTNSQEFEAGKIENSYKKFTAEGTKWMVIALEMNPRVKVVDWAKSVVAANPDYNVAFTSHYILNGDASISTSNAGYGDTSGRYLYDNLFLKYPNVKLVFSGHVGMAGTRVDTGVNGNKVAGFVGTFHQNDYNPTRFVTINVANNIVTSDIQAASIRDAYKSKYPNATLPTYNEYDVSYSGMNFIR